jgi:hypothetical protein
MSYLTRLKALSTEKGIPNEPTKLTNPPCVGFVSNQGSPISSNDVAVGMPLLKAAVGWVQLDHSESSSDAIEGAPSDPRADRRTTRLSSVTSVTHIAIFSKTLVVSILVADWSNTTSVGRRTNRLPPGISVAGTGLPFKKGLPQQLTKATEGLLSPMSVAQVALFREPSALRPRFLPEMTVHILPSSTNAPVWQPTACRRSISTPRPG